MTALLQPAFVSVEDYLAGEERSDVKHEYLGGVVHAMAGGTADHATIAVNAILALGSALRGKSCRPFSSDMRLRLQYSGQTRFYYPDAFVVCEPNTGGNLFQDRPVVVLEVLSESTRRTDLGEKREAYQMLPSVKVLMFVEPDRPYVLVDRRSEGGAFSAEAYSGLDATVPLPEIGCSLSLAELYEHIAFSETSP